MKTPNNKKSPQQLELLLQQQAAKIAQLEKAQAIEVALDKVRGRTMAMKHPEELREVVAVLQEQITALQIADWGSNILIAHEETLVLEHWIASFNQAEYPESYVIKGKEHPVLEEYWTHYYAQTPHFTIALMGEKRLSYNEYVFNHTDLKRFPAEVKAHINTLSESYFCYAHMKYGHLAALGTAPLSEENFIILARFAKVFEQTYTRFLDLQKAETQAKEAQIQAALERVRTASMGMHKSEELIKVATIMYGEFKKLGIAQSASAGFGLIDEEKKIQLMWSAQTNSKLLKFLKMPLHGDKVLAERYKAWKNKQPIFSQVLKAKELKKHLEVVMPATRITEEAAAAKLDMPDPTFFYFGNFQQGYLQIISAETLSLDHQKLLARFAYVFEQCYTRFLDLQKAEAQAREAQIEAALERVRSRIMWMQRSHELREVVSVMYDEMELLGLAKWGCNIMICHKDKEVFEFWLAEETDANQTRNYFVKGKAHPVYQKIWTNWENQTNAFTLHHQDEYKLTFDKYWLEETDFKHLPDEVKANVYNRNEVFLNYAPMKHGLLNAISYEKLSDKLLMILARFAKVFEQTYTRFLDLQKAEAQAKEAQIEAALERVRAASMAMHNSSEMQQVVQAMYEQMQPFGISSHATSLEIFDVEKGLIDCWFAHHLNSYHITHYEIKGKKNHTIREMWKCWEEQQPNMTIHLKGEKKKKYDTYLLNETGFKNIPEALKKDIRSYKEAFFNYCSMRYGLIQVVDHNPIPAENIVIIQRFAKIFEQSYTRFLDLQRAENQAREAQIEASLERVRARTMAMHQSEEFAQVASVMFKEFHQLGLINNIARTVININHEENGDCMMWITRFGGAEISTSFEYNYLENELWEKEYRAYQKVAKNKRKEHKYTVVHEGEAWQALLDFSYEKEILTPEEVKIIKDQGIQKWIEHIVWFAYGSVVISRETPLSEEGFNILQRFTAVFEQTYTRFLDLQKAEAQARESQIEAALERVRARTMAMHKSDELRGVISGVFEQLNGLGFDMSACGLVLFEKADLSYTLWVAGFETEDFPESYQVPYFDHPYYKAQLAAWQNGQSYQTFLFEGKLKESYDDFVFNHGDFKFLPQTAKEAITSVKSTTCCDAFMAYGMLEVIAEGTEAISDEQAIILQRFAKVFEQTYTRFLDLKRAETQAREAQIEVALERVRARAMAMRHSDELSEAAELLYQEFIKLGVEPFSCGYLINDEEKGEWKIWLTNPGEPFFKEYWTIPYTADHNLQARYESWKNKEAFHCAILEGAANQAHHQVICQYAPWKEEVTDNLAPQLVFNSAHFSLGHLLVISPDRLSAEMEQAMARFANVFDLTYRRFLDLEKSEEQNRQLEKTFEENQRLLHSILPEQIAEQIRQGQQTVVKRFEQVSILFADIVGFTILSEKISPQEVVDILNGLFSKFDDLTDKYGLEKIKTIGDAYMVASGVPEEKADHAHVLFQFAQDMLQAVKDFNQVVGTQLKIRIGISSGPVVAGVIGKKKFAYDLWGDSVNMAARMEAYGRQDCIQVSPTTYGILKKDFAFKRISNVEIKGKGIMDVYLWEA